MSPVLRSMLLLGASCLSLAPAWAQTAAPATAADEKVVVTGSPLTRSADRYSRIVTTVTREEGLAHGGASLADALATLPGLAGTTTAPGASRPVVRGFDATRVYVTENGIGTQDVAEIGPDHNTPVDILTTDRIEVVRGAATLRYGSQAIGGVINVLNGRIPYDPLDGWKAELAGIFGDAATSAEGGAMVKFGGEGFAVHADGFYRNAGNYETPVGTQLNSWAHANGGAVGATRFWSQGSFGASIQTYDGKYGLPSGDAFIDVVQDKANVRGVINVANSALERIVVEGGISDYEHEEIEPTGDVAAVFLNEEGEARAEAIFGQVGPLSGLALGMHLQDRVYSALGEAEDFILPAEAFSIAAYGFGRIALGAQTELEGSLRIEGADRQGTPLSDVLTNRSYAPLSASLGLVWKPQTETTVGLTATSAGRAPGLPELFARGPHEGTETYETGDPDLDTERSNSVELTARYETERFSVSGAVWGSWFDGFIFGELTGNLCDEMGDCTSPPGAELAELFYVQRDADFWGFEAEGRAVLADLGEGTQLGVTAQADYVRGELGDGSNVPRLPPLRYGGGLFVEAPRWHAKLRVLHVSEAEDLAFLETPTDAYTDVSAEATWRAFEGEAGSFDLTLVGRNLGDEVQRNHVSFVKDSVVLPGRDVRIIGRFRF